MDNEYLITASDVVRYTPLHKDTSLQLVCNFMDCEITAMECFGDYYDTLLADVVDLAQYNEFDIKVNYNQGNRVVYCNVCYQRNGEAMEEADERLPSCSDFWEVCPRFNTDCHNKIWKELRAYLAWTVYFELTPFLQVQTGGGGMVMVTSSKNTEPVNEKWYYSTRNHIKSSCAKKLAALKKKILRLCETECKIFNAIEFVQAACGDSCDPEDKVFRSVAWPANGRTR